MIHRLGMLELMTPCMLVPPPHFIGSLEQRKKVVMWFSNKLVFLRQSRGHGCKEWSMQPRDRVVWKTIPLHPWTGACPLLC